MNFLRISYKTHINRGVLRVVFFYLIFTLFISCNTSRKENFLTPKESVWIKNNAKKIDVLFGYQAPPSAFYNKSGDYEGLLVDYYKEIELILGVKFNFKKFDTWSELIEYAKTANDFIIVGIAKTQERSGFLNFTKPFVDIPYVIFSKKGAEISSMDDLLNKRVCITSKYAVSSYLKEYYPNLKFENVDQDLIGLRGVATGDFDAMITNQMYGTYTVENEAIVNLKIAGDSGYVNPLGVAVSKENPELVKILYKAVEQIDADRRKDILNKWVSTSSNKISKQNLKVINTIIGFILVLIVILWLWLISLKKQVAKKTTQILKSEEKYRALIENSNEAFFIIYKQRFELVNKKFEELFKYSEKELKSKNFKITQLIGSKNKLGVDELISLNNKDSLGPFIYKFEGLTKNKDKLYLEAHASYLKYEDEYAIQGIIHDSTEQRYKELELLESKEKAEESDRLKTAFLANMSHEIRTPMNGILGFADLLDTPNLTDNKRKKFISIIKQSGSRMLDTVNDIIDISKIETNQVNVVLTEVNINEKIETLFSFFEPEAKNKDIQLSFKNELTDKLSVIKSDNQKIDSILTNLIKNAIKFTKQGSVVFGYEVVNVENQNFLKFFVKDTGIGIPKNRHNAIFNRFEQADIEDQEAHQGSGLGLAISKSYVEMLKGRIWFDSIEDKGSQFYFTLPFDLDVTRIYNEEVVEIKEKDSHQLNKLNILIVEDDEISALYLSELLKSLKASMVHVKTGEKAIEYCVNNNNVDLVLMDIKMEGMGGYKAVEKIRSFNKELIIIAQTAYTLTGDREKAIEAGCNDYIEKPIDKTVLLKKVENYLLNKIL